MEIINGLDGRYMIYQGKLVKIVAERCSENWFQTTSGWHEYTLENGMVIVYGDQNGVRFYG